MRTSGFLVLLLALLSGHSGSVRAQGAIVLTGHDADFHHIKEPPPDNPRTEGFITACLDFLVFGKKASPEQVGKRPATKIAYLDGWIHRDGSNGGFKLVSGYANPIVLDLLADDWHSALVPGAFDVVMIGSYNSLRPENMDALLGGKERFQTFLNRGGKLFVMVQQYQEDYGFLPRFGAAAEALDNVIGNFYTTRAGDSIGITDNMINTDFTHQQFKNVDTSIFKVFERTRETTSDGQHDLPVTIGFNGLLKDTIFVPVDSVSRVQQPRSTVPSGSFADSVCIEFFTPTDSAGLAYSLNGAVTTASPTLANHGRLCFRQTTTIRLVGQRTGWKDSPDTVFTYTLIARPPSALALFSGGLEITEVTFTDVQLEARLTRPTGLACTGCTVQVTPSGSADAERLPLTAQGAFFHAAFARAESLFPVAGDGTLQHGPTDSVVLTWVNPLDAKDVARKAYPYRPKPPVIPLAPTLSLFYRGQEITVVDASQRDLDIRLTLDSAEACLSCPVLVFPSTGSDTETVVLTGGASPYQGGFRRDLEPRAIPGDGTIQHDRQDSIVLLYRHTLDPASSVRRSYPFLPAPDTVVIRPQNTIAHTAEGQSSASGPQWIISDAPGLLVAKQAGIGSCCAFAATPVNARNPDSLRLVGIVIEASHGFYLDLRVFSTLGEAVSRIVFTVPESEFPKLTAVEGRETRFMRVLWNGRTREGSRAGNGAYILKTSISLLPLAPSPGVPEPMTTERRVGILRSAD